MASSERRPDAHRGGRGFETFQRFMVLPAEMSPLDTERIQRRLDHVCDRTAMESPQAKSDFAAKGHASYVKKIRKEVYRGRI